MGNRREHLVRQIVKVCRKLDLKGMVANHDGNVSCRFDEGFLATPTAESKAEIEAAMVIELDSAGKKVAGIGSPFSELKIHLQAYATRPDAKAVVHAHPIFASARGLVGLELVPNFPEAVVSIGGLIPVTPYGMPGSAESDRAVADALAVSDIMMIPGNGVLAIGDDLEQAYLRIELLEHLCKMDHYARTLGQPLELPQADMDALIAKRRSIGLGPEARGIPQPLSAETPLAVEAINASASVPGDLQSKIANEIRQVLMEGRP